MHALDNLWRWRMRGRTQAATPWLRGASWALLIFSGSAALSGCQKDGTPGPMGTMGSPGEPGSMGAKGEPGPPGPMGAKGEPGLAGPAGKDGAKGEAGAQGPAGAAGPPGPTGATGTAGPPGATGPAGTPGATGPAGPSGPMGSPGPAGAPGASGAYAEEIGAFAGFTPTTYAGSLTSGAAVGRLAAHALCAAAFSGSHLCHASEYLMASSPRAVPGTGPGWPCLKTAPVNRHLRFVHRNKSSS